MIDYIVSHGPSIGAFITAALSLVASIRNSRKLTTIKVEINGRMGDLLAETRKAAHAEGLLAGKDGTTLDDLAVRAP